MTDTTQLRRHHVRAEYAKGTSNKFYETTAQEMEIGITSWEFRWGRIGTAGQTKKGTSYTFDGAVTLCKQQMRKKLDKGYIKVSASPLRLLGQAIQDEAERQTNGLPPANLEIPTNWGMYTPAGNKRITKFAKKYLDKLNLIRASYYDLSNDKRLKQVNKLLEQYVREYDRIARGKSFGEAGDTAVREAVGNFFDRLRENSAGRVDWRIHRWDDLR